MFHDSYDYYAHHCEHGTRIKKFLPFFKISPTARSAIDKHGVMDLILSDAAGTRVLTSTCQPLKGGWPGAEAWRPRGQSPVEGFGSFLYWFDPRHGSICFSMEILVQRSFPRSCSNYSCFECFLNDQQVRKPHETQPLLVQMSNGCIDTNAGRRRPALACRVFQYLYFLPIIWYSLARSMLCTWNSMMAWVRPVTANGTPSI